MSGQQSQDLPDDPGEFPAIGQYDLVPEPGDAGYVQPADDGMEDHPDPAEEAPPAVGIEDLPVDAGGGDFPEPEPLTFFEE